MQAQLLCLEPWCVRDQSGVVLADVSLDGFQELVLGPCYDGAAYAVQRGQGACTEVLALSFWHLVAR